MNPPFSILIGGMIVWSAIWLFLQLGKYFDKTSSLALMFSYIVAFIAYPVAITFVGMRFGSRIEKWNLMRHIGQLLLWVGGIYWLNLVIQCGDGECLNFLDVTYLVLSTSAVFVWLEKQPESASILRNVKNRLRLGSLRSKKRDQE